MIAGAGSSTPANGSLARATCSHAERGAAINASCPARLHASANGTSGPIFPAPQVLARRMRIVPETPGQRTLFHWLERVEDRADDAALEREEQQHEDPHPRAAVRRPEAQRRQPRADAVQPARTRVPALGVQIRAADGAAGGERAHRLTAVRAAAAVR